jgi:teichoic acid transport system ATP-binding protein
MYVRLAFATAINVDPDILIIDEVLAVGDDMFKRRCYRKLDDFKEQGKTILFVSHSLVSITTLCSRALLLDKGHIIEIGSPNDVAKVYNKLLSERDENYQKKASERQNKEIQSQSSEEKVDLAENSTNSEYRYGAGGAEILEVTIVNSKNESLDTIEHGEIFTIKVSVLFKKDMKEPGLGYTIKTLSGVDITGTNTFLSEAPIGQVRSGLTVEINFKQKMSLNPGSYSLTSGVVENTDKEMIYHDRRMDVKILKVIGKKNSTGFYGMDSKVEITINPDKDSSV